MPNLCSTSLPGCVVALGALLTGAASCGPGDNGARPGIADSAGVRIVTVDPAAPVAEWLVDTVPVTEIGNGAADPAHQLFRVASAVRLGDGTVVVSNTGSNEVRLFDSSGTHIRSFGGNGDGPGEFRWLATVLASGDTIIAFDRTLQRATLFSRTGAVLGTSAMPATSAGSIGRFDDGSLVATSFLVGMPTRAPGMHADTAAVERYSSNGVDTLSRVVTLRWYSRGPGSIPLVQSLAPETQVAADGSHLLVGPSSQLGYRIHALDGRLEGIVRVALPAPAMTDSAWNIAKQKAFMARPPDRRDEFDAEWHDMERPAHLPLLRNMVCGSDGTIWLQEYAGDGNGRWWIFDAEGALLARATLPAGVSVLSVTANHVVGRRSTSDGERIVVLRIQR